MSSASPPAAPTPRGCCENGRPVLTDPHTGQTVCSCQYSPGLLGYPRGLPPGLESVYSASAYAAAVSQGYMALGAEGSAFYSPLGSSPYDLKDAEAWRTLAAQPAFPYDPMSLYPYGAGYGGLDLTSRRKNATRENTNTLKAWLYEHRKNPYPTKGEKIMLAIITKMTLTQVSTWFANARRRLKKENKMTWSPRNRSEDGSEAGDNPDESDLGGERGDSGSGRGAGEGEDDDEIDVGPLSPGREIDVINGMSSSPRPTSALSHSGHDAEGKEGIINVDEDSCSSFKDHLNHRLRRDLLLRSHVDDDDHEDDDDPRRRLYRDRSPLRGEERARDLRDLHNSSRSHSDQEEEERVAEAGGRNRKVKDGHCGSEDLRVRPAGSGSSGGRDLASDPKHPSPTTNPPTTTTSSSIPVRPKIWSVSEFLNPPTTTASSAASSTPSCVTSTLTSQNLTSSQAAMMTAAAAAAARAAMLAQAANGGDAGRVPPGPHHPLSGHPFPPGMRPAGLSSGYLFMPSAAWAAAGARFGPLGAYPLSGLSHSTLSYPYSLSAHPAAVTKASLGEAGAHPSPGAAAAAMRSLNIEALREAHLTGKLTAAHHHHHHAAAAAGAPRLGAGPHSHPGQPSPHAPPPIFSPARDLDVVPRSSPAVSSGRLVESNI